MKDLSLIFRKSLETTPEYQEAITLLNRDAVGNMWLIGGFIYRTLASHLYGTPKSKVDLDFIVKKRVDSPDLPTGWAYKVNSFGNLKYISQELSIDVVPLENIHSIKSRNLEPSIENYLSGTPLTIQSIAYDVQKQKLIGSIGINALLTRNVSPHNRESIEYVTQLYNISSEEYVVSKASSLEFHFEF